MSAPRVVVRAADDRDPADRAAIERIAGHWGRAVARAGELVDPSALPRLLAVDPAAGAVVGVVTYRPGADDDPAGCEVVTLDADPPGRGTGRALLDAVVERAAATGCSVVWLVTTNDNVGAQRCYERCGFTLVHVDAGAVDRARVTLKPSIPPTSADGTPIRDELRYERGVHPGSGPT